MSDSCSFGSAKKLCKRTEYQAVFSTGKRVGDRQFLFIIRQNYLLVPRLGLAISRKTVPLAARRNRLKRIIRESFRQRQPLLKGLDIVVQAKKQINHASNDVVFKNLEKCWERVKK